jgi:hypothetical protein
MSPSWAASHASISRYEYDQLREPTLVRGGPSPRRCLRLRVSSLIPRYLAAPGKFVRPRGRDAASSSLRNRARKSSSSDWRCSVGIFALAVALRGQKCARREFMGRVARPEFLTENQISLRKVKRAAVRSLLVCRKGLLEIVLEGCLFSPICFGVNHE